MTDVVYQSLKNMLSRRPKVRKEPMVDGYSGFIRLDKNGNPKVALHIENEVRWAMKKYCKLHPERPLPHITPHVFRHTFCTNMANAGMDIKNLQYLMGHSDAGSHHECLYPRQLRPCRAVDAENITVPIAGKALKSG